LDLGIKFIDFLILLAKIPLHVLQFRILNLSQLEFRLLQLVLEHLDVIVLHAEAVHLGRQLLVILLEGILHVLLYVLHLSQLVIEALANLLIIIPVLFDHLVLLL